MANVTQLTTYGLNVVNQMLGKANISSIDDTTVVDIGREVGLAIEGDDTFIDRTVKKLMVECAKKQIIDSDYVSSIPSLYVDSYDWGGFIERIYMNIGDIKDGLWIPTDNTDYSEIEHTFHKPNVKAKVFPNTKTFRVDYSITRDAFMDAFKGEDEFASFMSLISKKAQDTIKAYLDIISYSLLRTAIVDTTARKNNAIHIYDECVANGIITALTQGESETDKAFAKRKANAVLNSRDAMMYAVKRIDDKTNEMSGMNYVYGEPDLLTRCEKVDIIAIAQFINNIKYRVEPTLYKSIMSDDMLEVVNAWQGINQTSSNAFDFDNVTNIQVDKTELVNLGVDTSDDFDGKTGTGANVSFNGDYCVALLKDRRSIGICPQKVKTTSSYTASADFWNTFINVLVGFLYDNNLGTCAVYLV